MSNLLRDIDYCMGMLLRSPWVLVRSSRGSFSRVLALEAQEEAMGGTIQGPCIVSPRGGYGSHSRLYEAQGEAMYRLV